MAAAVTKTSRSTNGKKRKRSEAEIGDGPDRGFRLLRYQMTIPLAPVHSANIEAGVLEILDSWATKYVPSLGVVLCTVSHETLQIAPTAHLVTPTAIAAVPVIFECIGWRPKIGSSLSARVVTHTREHVSLLIHNAFNAKISSEHIPSDQYSFDSDKMAPAIALNSLWQAEWEKLREEEEMTRAQIEGLEIASNIDEAQTERAGSVAQSTAEGHVGCWVDRETGEPLGGEDGLIEFKVIGLTMLNATISVHGSLLENPFSIPAHIPSLPQPSISTLQAQRAPPATQPLANKAIHQPSVSADEDSEMSDLNDEEDNRPAVPLLPSASAKSKGKQKATIPEEPEAAHPEEALMQADKDDTAIQDPEQLSLAANLGTEGEVPQVKHKKKKKKATIVPGEAETRGMELDSPEQPLKQKKKRKSEAVQEKENAMDLDEQPKKKAKTEKTKKPKTEQAQSVASVPPQEEASAAIDLSTLLPGLTQRKEVKPEKAKKLKDKSEKKKAKQK